METISPAAPAEPTTLAGKPEQQRYDSELRYLAPNVLESVVTSGHAAKNLERKIRVLVAERHLDMVFVCRMLGIHFKTMQNWMARDDIRLYYLRKLAKILSVRPVFFLEESDFVEPSAFDTPPEVKTATQAAIKVAQNYGIVAGSMTQTNSVTVGGDYESERLLGAMPGDNQMLRLQERIRHMQELLDEKNGRIRDKDELIGALRQLLKNV